MFATHLYFQVRQLLSLLPDWVDVSASDALELLAYEVILVARQCILSEPLIGATASKACGSVTVIV